MLARAALFTIALSALGPYACSETRRPDGGAGLLAVGDVAPELKGEDASGGTVALSASRGHAAVVYFYPKDETPGCTKEACAFRDAWTKYQRAGIVVFGVSRDSAESHRAFATNHKLPFPLVADEGAEAERAYGVSSRFGMTSRVTFLVGADGRVARVWPNVDPALHADEVLAAATAATPASSAAAVTPAAN
jgi:peroxiredoxin Q/BCP